MRSESFSDHYTDEELSDAIAAGNSGQHSSTEERVTGSSSETKAAAQKLAEKKGTKSILLSKVFLVTTIVLSAAGVALLTYFYTSSLETSKFKTQFDDDALEVVLISERNVEKAFASLEDFSRTITSLTNVGGAANESFPLLTIPDWEVRAKDFSLVSGASWMAYIPLVSKDIRPAFEDYMNQSQGWVQDLYDATGDNVTARPIVGPVYKFVEDATSPLGLARQAEDYNVTQSYPLWQMYPPFEIFGTTLERWVGYNMWSSPEWIGPIQDATKQRKPNLSELSHTPLFGRATAEGVVPSPESYVWQPVFSANDDDEADIVGFICVYFPWDMYFMNILSDENRKVVAHVESSCGGRGDFMLEGSKVTTLPPHVIPENATAEEAAMILEEHSPLINDDIQVTSDFAELLRCHGDDCSEFSCDFTLHVFPAHDNDDQFYSPVPIYATIVVLVLFAFTSLVFVLYDYVLQRRNSLVIESAQKTNAIVAKLFPTQIHDRLFGLQKEEEEDGKSGANKIGINSFIPETSSKFKLNSFLSGNTKANPQGSGTQERGSLADFFPSATIMFGDVKGFSAWASVRSPSDVFTLLETIYSAFDKLAKRRKILKVESIKDSYLAVCGVPTPREDHAIIMTRFAQECNDTMNRLVQFLEKMLGPGTSALSMRFGLHSGPVTAGVLRGAKARFQLFGDTVNTAARMESTGEARRIHISAETAKLLGDRGKGHWLKPRETSVVAKGKGKLQTYWATPKVGNTSSNAGSQEGESTDFGNEFMVASNSFAKNQLNMKLQRIVDWNTELLLKLLKQVVARRRSTKQEGKPLPPTGIKRRQGATVMDEVTEIVKLPKFKASKNPVSPDSIELGDAVEEQLEDFVANVALMYRDNPFHSYEHASHVSMSCHKMLSRIVAPEIQQPSSAMPAKEYQAQLHDHTYGITSDPLMHFSLVFSALVHDADHPGVPNATLVNEQDPVAIKYNNKSVAEQNSVDLAWDLLMREEYKDLRECIYTTQSELERFRQWVVTTVMSTDIVDKDLKKLRNDRWERAFSENVSAFPTSSPLEDQHRKATIVVEHIIQASDISHTMQHWHVYLKWNEKFFHEMYAAYKDGRSDRDPSEFWYKGELGFYDFYIIPLAKKLKECGVFGVSSNEYLDYALANRREWEVRGKEVVEGYIATYSQKQEQKQKKTIPTGILLPGWTEPVTNIVEC